MDEVRRRRRRRRRTSRKEWNKGAKEAETQGKQVVRSFAWDKRDREREEN